MIKNNILKNSNLNKFFRKIILKKQYLQALKDKIHLLHVLKEYKFKNLNLELFSQNNILLLKNVLIHYIIYISFFRSNIRLHVMNFLGESKFFCSAGTLFYYKNKKKVRVSILKSMMHLLLKKLKFLSNKSIALHLNNVKFIKHWILKKFKTKFFIWIVKSFNSYVYNGCRKKKMRRKK